MSAPSVLVFDAGKSFAKITLFARDGIRLRHETRALEPQATGLDCDGIADWFISTLADVARHHPIDAIIPIGHGAAAALIAGDQLIAPVADYEQTIPPDIAQAYAAGRDAFALTGSPLLPAGLNLGAQLHALEHRRGAALPATAQILLWPQYWAWWLAGVAHAEVTSLGCHSDLWCPATASPSPMAARRGWAALLPPLAHAGSVAGPMRHDLARQIGLPRPPIVHVGLHDSNAALLAARRAAGTDVATVSTGTWFVAMGPPGLRPLPQDRDCLLNVDVDGRPVPSARWMGGRELEMLLGAAPPATMADDSTIAAVLAGTPPIRPSFQPGRPGQWRDRPAEAEARAIAAQLHAALMIDALLDLTGAGRAVVMEGRFACYPLLMAALAALRAQPVHALPAAADAAAGAFGLVRPQTPAIALPPPVAPLPLPLTDYRSRWQELAA